MRVSAPVALLVLALGVVPGVAVAQSLGEVAEREKARREKEAKDGKARRPVKVITGDELRSGGSSGTVSHPASNVAAASAGTGSGTAAAASGAAGATGQPAKSGEPEKTEDELRAERQQEWRQRVQDAQAEVARLRSRVDQLQTSLNDMSGPIYGPNRASLASQLEQAKTALTAAEQKVVALDEEGRRNRYR
jgi:hypothetical protein